MAKKRRANMISLETAKKLKEAGLEAEWIAYTQVCLKEG